MEDTNQGQQDTTNDIQARFVSKARSSFGTLMGEVSLRNKRIQENDQYIYGDRLQKMLQIAPGHDLTNVNWLRRTVEIHRAQFMGKGFAVDSNYFIDDPNNAGDDPQQKQRIIIENERRKAYANKRRMLIDAIKRDNGGNTLWEMASENASAVGDSVIKAWYDDDEKKYKLQLVETLENVYALWNKDDYRKFDAIAYVYQISKQEAIDEFNVPEDIVMSPLGSPLVMFASINVAEYRSTQPMVTVMEVTGKIPGFKVSPLGELQECKLGDETELNATIVGNVLHKLIWQEKYLPKYYILPNKHARRRPWGIPDITEAAININISYIEALSDWRTVASKVNFPKFKGYGFPLGIQIPKPKARTIEILPLANGQDIQPLVMGQSAGLGESDFRNQINELENQFVREVGVSRQLFDMPDSNSGSNPALLTAMKSISDITNSKRGLWEPIIRQIFEDALRTIALWNDDVKKVVDTGEEWSIQISWPSALNADDPSFHAMKLNQFNTGVISIQTMMEELGYDAQELERIRTEMEDPLLAAIHGHQLGQIAAYKLIPPGTPLPPRVNVNLRGDLSPEQEANLAYERGMNNGPFGTTMGPQGNQGLTAQANTDNQGLITGNNPTGGYSVSKLPNGQVAPQLQNGGVLPKQETYGMAQKGNLPELINGAGMNQPGMGIMSQPGSGAPMTSAKGKLKQHEQRRGQ